RLCVKSQHQRAWIACVETIVHDVRPQTSCSTKLRDLLEQIVMRVEEKRNARSELIYFQTSRQRRLDIRNSISKCKSNFLNRGRTGFTNVITADRDRVPVGHFASAVREDVRNQTQRRRGRINVGAARDVLFQNIVLQGAANF